MVLPLAITLKPPNGLASRSIPEGGSGSGGTGETPLYYRADSGKTRMIRERRSHLLARDTLVILYLQPITSCSITVLAPYALRVTWGWRRLFYNRQHLVYEVKELPIVLGTIEPCNISQVSDLTALGSIHLHRFNTE